VTIYGRRIAKWRIRQHMYRLTLTLRLHLSQLLTACRTNCTYRRAAPSLCKLTSSLIHFKKWNTSTCLCSLRDVSVLTQWFANPAVSSSKFVFLCIPCEGIGIYVLISKWEKLELFLVLKKNSISYLLCRVSIMYILNFYSNETATMQPRAVSLIEN
jgi:hypothetical protein